MRVALVFLWWQVSRHDPERAPAARSYMATIGVAQVGWVIAAVLALPIGASFAVFAVLIAFELRGPFIAERKAPTPWHPHHIAERYGLLVIITLGEVILGTVASLNAVVHGEAGWSVDAALLAIAGVGLTFASWWMYFAVPWGEVLVRHRERAFRFGYGHLFIFGALAAMGGGLHVAALTLEHEAKIGATGAVLSVAIPFAIYVAVFYVLYSAPHAGLRPVPRRLGGGDGRAAAAVRRARHGRASAWPCAWWCSRSRPRSPSWVTRSSGHRHMAEALERL